MRNRTFNLLIKSLRLPEFADTAYQRAVTRTIIHKLHCDSLARRILKRRYLARESRISSE
jgi:hypothetical protein